MSRSDSHISRSVGRRACTRYTVKLAVIYDILLLPVFFLQVPHLDLNLYLRSHRRLPLRLRLPLPNLWSSSVWTNWSGGWPLSI